MTNNYKVELQEKVNQLISGNQTVPQFKDAYYRYFHNDVPEDALNESSDTFFGLIAEVLDWTAENPDTQEAKDGWISYGEYIEWLKTMSDEFLGSESLWYAKYLSKIDSKKRAWPEW